MALRPDCQGTNVKPSGLFPSSLLRPYYYYYYLKCTDNCDVTAKTSMAMAVFAVGVKKRVKDADALIRTRQLEVSCLYKNVFSRRRKVVGDERLLANCSKPM